MKKILFIISGELFLRNYIRTGVIDYLSKNYDCKIIADRKIYNKVVVEKLENFAGYYISDPKEFDKRRNLMSVISWRYRKKSSTFSYRIMWFTGLRTLNFFSSLTHFKEFLSFVKINLTRRKNVIKRSEKIFTFRRNKLLPMIFGNLIIFSIFMFFYKKTLTLNRSLEKYIESIKPDIILFPSTAYEPISYDILEIGTKKKVKILFLIDNWDNLSSKTLFLRKPDFITVWGRQTLEHGVNIQGLKEKQIIMIGTPRFDIYYKTLNNLPKSPINGKYVLFLGVALEMDEIGALKELDKELEQNKDLYGDLKIIYRPHPWRHGKKDFNESDFKHVELDMQMKDTYLRLKKYDDTYNKRTIPIEFQPNMDYYPAIIGNANFIVASLTTMAIEALIMEKKVLLIVYDDGQNYFTTPKNVFNYCEHFRGIEKLKGFVFCKEKSRLRQQFRDTYVNMRRDGFKSIKSDLSYFLFNDNREYQQRLFDAIQYTLK